MGWRLKDWANRAVLCLFYFGLFAPIGLAMRLLQDPLCLTPKRNTSLWRKRAVKDASIEDARTGY